MHINSNRDDFTIRNSKEVLHLFTLSDADEIEAYVQDLKKEGCSMLQFHGQKMMIAMALLIMKELYCTRPMQKIRFSGKGIAPHI